MGEGTPGWDDIFGQCPAEVVAIAAAARAAIRSADPDTVETASPGHGAVNFGVGPRKMADGYAYLMPQKDRVNLGFFHGVDLPDPAGLLEGTGKALRHVKLRSAWDVERAETRALIAAAVAERRARMTAKQGADA